MKECTFSNDSRALNPEGQRIYISTVQNDGECKGDCIVDFGYENNDAKFPESDSKTCSELIKDLFRPE